MKATHPSNTQEGRLVCQEGRVAGFIEIQRYRTHAVLLQKIVVDDMLYGLFATSWVRGMTYRKLRTEFESQANALRRNVGMMADLIRKIDMETELRTLTQVNNQLSEVVA
jgi:hypothetical protein